MGLSLRESVEEIADPRHLDASVEEVFGLMLGSASPRVELEGTYGPEAVTAVVGFAGVLSGACVLSTSGAVACDIAARMLGMPFGEVDDMVKDAVGEICNMLAGAWKSRVPRLAAQCGLSVPAVITGRDYKLHVQAPEFRVHHWYALESQHFSVTIVCDGLR